MADVTQTCPKCGGVMERGRTTALGLRYAQREVNETAKLLFVVEGTPTSINPVAAFKQGLGGEPDDRHYRIEGVRCAGCGFLELYANDAW